MEWQVGRSVVHLVRRGRVTVWLLLTAGIGLTLFSWNAAIAQPPQKTADVKTAPDETAVSFLNPTDPTKDSIGDDLPENAIMRFGTHRFQHPSSVNTMLLSPDDKTVVTLNSDVFIVWDAATGKEKWRNKWSGEVGHHIMGPGYGQKFLCFSEDGKRLYSVAREQSIRVWDVETGEFKSRKLDIPKNPVVDLRDEGVELILCSIDVSKDGEKLLIGSDHGFGLFHPDGSHEWYFSNVPTKAIREIDERDRLVPDGEFSTALISPDAKVVAAILSQWPRRIQFIDAETADEAGRIELDSNPVRMVFSPDGSVLYVTLYDCGIHAYSTKTQKRLWVKQLDPDPKGAESYASAIDCSPDGKWIAAGAPVGPKHEIYVLDASSGKEHHILKTGWKPWATQFSSDSQTLYSTGWHAAIRRWDVATGKERPLPMGVRASGTITQSRDGQTVAVYAEGSVRLVNATNGKQFGTIEPKETSAGVLLFSPDAKTLHLAGVKDGQVGVESWNIESNTLVNSWYWPVGKDSNSDVEQLATTSDGRLLAAASFRQDKAYVWDTKTSEQIAILNHKDVYGLDFSPDDQTIATVGWDKNLRFWNLESEKLLATIDMTKAVGERPPGRFAGDGGLRMYGVRYAPDGNGLAVAHMDGLTLWPNPDFEDLRTFKNHSYLSGSFTFGALDYSPNGKFIAAGSSQGKVAIYSAADGAPLMDVGEHTSYTYTVRFGRDDRLVSGGGGISFLWDVSPAADQ